MTPDYAQEELVLADLSSEEFKAKFSSACDDLADAEQVFLHARGTGNARYINETVEELRLADNRVKEFRKELAEPVLKRHSGIVSE